MPRLSRCCPAGIPVHVVQRCNYRQACFASESDMTDFAKWLDDTAKQLKGRYKSSLVPTLCKYAPVAILNRCLDQWAYHKL